MQMIKVENISKQFKDTKALDQVSLQFEYGKIYGLLGRNGAGKSTLLKIISNRIFASDGVVYLNDLSTMENDVALRQMYMMSEEDLYPKSMKIKEVFHWTKEFYGCFDEEKAYRLADMFELNPKKRVKELSTGYQSIYKLIIALCLDVPYVFLDEPVLGLDANHRELFYKILLESYMEQQKTYVIATHLIEEVANLIEDIIIIDDGKVLINQSVEDILSSGYSISGTSDAVDAYCEGKKVIGSDQLGGLKSAYIMGDVDTEKLHDGLEVTMLNLQKLFVELTRKEKER